MGKQNDLMIVRSNGADERFVDPTEAKKALEAIDMRFTNRPISLLQHKIYNVWVAFAQSTVNAAQVRVFEFPLSEVMELCGFDSNNHSYFIDAARAMMELRVEYNSMNRRAQQPTNLEAPKLTKPRRKRSPETVRWSAAQLVSFIAIDSGLNVMRIEFPEVLRNEILRPDFYRTIDLRKQRRFSSRAGLALYEYVLRYAAEQRTPWLEWESYSLLLSGSIEPHKTFREFSKMLQRAMEQVNAHHDSHNVHAEFTKRGRAIGKMRIVISLKHQNTLGLDELEAPSPEVVRALLNLGLTTSDAANLSAGHPRAYMEAQIAYVQRRLSDRGRNPIKVPAAYLRAAVAGNYADYVVRQRIVGIATSDETTLATRPPEQSPVALAGVLTNTNFELPFVNVRKWYSGLGDDERGKLASEFLHVANPVIKKAIASTGLSSPVAAAALYSWLQTSGAYKEA